MLEDAPPRGLGERLLSLRAFSLLAPLPASELALVARLSSERDFQAGQILATEGEPVRAVQLLVSGSAAVSRAGEVIETACAFDTVGLLPVAAGMNHLSTVVAVEPIHALEVDAELVDEVLEDDIALFVRVLRLAARSVRTAGASTSTNSTSGDGRVAIAPGVLSGGRYHEAQLGSQRLLEQPLGHLDVARTLLVLRGAPLFRTAPVDGLAAFAKRLDLVRIPIGETFELAGAAAPLGMIVAGRAEITFPEGSAAQSIAEAGAGDVLGILEALDSGAPRLLCHARTELHLLRGAASDLLDVIEDHHLMGRRLMAEILGLTRSS
jgi:CRP-like cAMP-binding protein